MRLTVFLFAGGTIILWCRNLDIGQSLEQKLKISGTNILLYRHSL